MSKTKKRNKSGKSKGWIIHVLAEYRKDQDSTIYCERAEFKVPIRDQKQISESKEVRDVITQWAHETCKAGNYNSKFHFGIERWQILRG